MGLADDLKARVLVLDIETQRAIVECWGLFKQYISIDQVIEPSRILCVAAKWRGADKVLFASCWRDGDEDAYRAMMAKVAGWLDAADVCVTYNGTSFDIPWIMAEIERMEVDRPSPFRQIDLYRLNKKHFGAGQMSKKMEWSARRFLKDSKTPHGDLWSKIRYGTNAERQAAQKVMRQYNEHDVEITEALLERWLPFTNLNLAVYGRTDDELLRCTRCASTNVSPDGEWATNSHTYAMYKCGDCGSHSRGKRGKQRTELRPV